MFFWKAVGTNFVRICFHLGSILGGFGGQKSNKRGSGEVSKNSSKKVMQERQKVMQGSAAGGGVPLNNPHSTPGHHDKGPLDTL